MLIDQHADRRHVKKARIVEHRPAKRFAQTPLRIPGEVARESAMMSPTIPI
jgi:hypothetical protein